MITWKQWYYYASFNEERQSLNITQNLRNWETENHKIYLRYRVIHIRQLYTIFYYPWTIFFLTFVNNKNNTILMEILIVLVLIFVNGFLSMSEMAVVSAKIGDAWTLNYCLSETCIFTKNRVTKSGGAVLWHNVI